MQRAAAAKVAAKQSPIDQDTVSSQVAAPTRRRRNVPDLLSDHKNQNIQAGSPASFSYGEPVLVPDPPRSSKRKRSPGIRQPGEKEERKTQRPRLHPPATSIAQDSPGALLMATTARTADARDHSRGLAGGAHSSYAQLHGDPQLDPLISSLNDPDADIWTRPL